MKNYTCSTTKIHPCGHTASKPKPKRSRKVLSPAEVMRLQAAYIKATSCIGDRLGGKRGEEVYKRFRVCWGETSPLHGIVYVIARGANGGDHLLKIMTDGRGKPVSILLCMVTPMALSALRAVVDIIEGV